MTFRLSSLPGALSSCAPELLTFLYLQSLDFLTTVVALKFGFVETSPFIRLLMHASATTGVAESKVLAIVLAIVCVAVNRGYLVRWINRWYAAVVIWNLVLMWLAPK